MSIQDVLDSIVNESLRRKGLSRLLTLKALVDLGDDWHKSGEVMNWLKAYKVHNNYIFEMAKRYPALVEMVPSDDRVRLRPNAYDVVAKEIDSVIRTTKKSLAR